MKHIVFSIFIFPWEIDGLERILTALKESSCLLENPDKFTLSVTLDLSDTRVDWSKSVIPKEYFRDKFDNIKKICNWADISFDTNEELNCFGSADKRRNDHKKFKCDAFVWLDPDMYFPINILSVLSAAINQTQHPYYIITPEIIRYWDASWDVITNKAFLNEAFNHRDYFDMYSVNAVAQRLDAPYIDKLDRGMVKFGGGWFTCISSKLLDLATVPSFIGPYGPDDTWVTAFALNYNNKLQRAEIVQYVMRNVVTTELGKTYVVENHYKKYISLKDVDIEAHKKTVWDKFQKELGNHLNKL
jgi:hypothetical protein